MFQSPSPSRRRLVVCSACTALVLGAVVATWVLVHHETFVPVRGMITVDGKPLQAGTVTFYPNRARGNTYSRSTGGKIKDGTYELLTYDEKGVAKKGLPAGWYRVVVEGFVVPDRGAPTVTPANIKIVGQGSDPDERVWTPGPPIGGHPNLFFSNYDKPHSVEVTKSGEDSYDLRLKRPPPQRQQLRRR